jgi:hypothetical protein
MHEFRTNREKRPGTVKRENGSFTPAPITEYRTVIPEEYILAPDEDLARAITGEELLRRLIARITNFESL